ncbi:TonB-dependent receptor [Sphingobium naphthae]|uniref:TonB-dependent receptor n=1 Tax=Sphingobium naphthae TaxID=1886786 RepID=A0ABU4A146_9SPHN|nr:TonB-dependent receptor [Sphingobium naphthae]MCC4250838.1 TonB-dependent receptor [Sphingobium naphthae]MDV5825479.1 TonB-dependent receptor [Sphingobium naphthae]
MIVCSRALLVSASMLAASTAMAQKASPPANPTPAPAQDVTSATQSANGGHAGIEDIVVTARRTEERLQTTPVAVTALSSQSLETAQVQDATDLQRVTPSFSIQTGGPSVSGLVFVSIRGQQNQNPGTANDPTVATYIDGVYVPRPSQGQTDLDDLQRLEVLRGPQGTLFGRNTTGGAVNIITADPKDYFEVIAKGEVGNYSYRSAGLTVNAPLADGLALRVTGNYHDRDGYVRNRALGTFADDPESYFVRGKLRYEGAGFDITLSGDYNKINDNGQKVGLIAFNPAVFSALPGGAGVPALLAPYVQTKATWYETNGTAFVLPTVTPAGTTIYNSLPADVQALYLEKPQNQVIAYGFGGTINVDLGGDLALKSITGYRYSNSTGLIDTDGTPVPLLTTRSGYGSEQFSQEVQLSGRSGDFSYILGGYYGHETGYESSVSQTFGFIPAPRFITENAADVTNITKGLFAQGTYSLTPELRFTGGLRWTWDNRNVVLHNKSRLGDPSTCTLPDRDPGTLCDQTQKASFDYPAWTVGLDYQASRNAFLYIQSRGASKSGGWNVRAGSIPAFAPERVRDIEAGAKLDWFDRRLRTNVALFFSWTEGLQKQIGALIPGTTQPTQYLINAGNANIYGAEFEVTAVPATGLELNANLSLLDGQYQKGSFTEVQSVGGVNVTVDRSNEPLPQLAKVQFMVGATQTVPLSFGDLRIHADYAYIGPMSISPVTAAPGVSAAVKATYDTQNALTRIKGYGLLNGRIGLQLDNPNVELFVFARNILDKKYTTRVFADLYTQGLGFVQRTVGDPFTIGGGLTVRFGSR